jgi:hypothetical protein
VWVVQEKQIALREQALLGLAVAVAVAIQAVLVVLVAVALVGLMGLLAQPIRVEAVAVGIILPDIPAALVVQE